MKEFLKPKNKEFKEYLIYSLVLGFMFSFMYFRFSNNYNLSVLNLFLKISIFIFIILISRLIFMKLIAYRNGIELISYTTIFDIYWLRYYDRLTYYNRQIKKYGNIDNFKGFQSYFMSLFIYFLSLGFLIYPCLFNFKYKKIPHKHLGTLQIFETTHIIFEHHTRYRESKILFGGTIFYIFIAFILKILSQNLGFNYYNIFTFILYYLAIFNLLPIPGSEGFSLYDKNSFAWISAITIVIISMIALLIFHSLTYFIIISTLSIIIVMFVNLYNYLMK